MNFGDFLSNGNETLYYGDVIDVLKNKIKNESINLIFADPPYNIGKKFSTNQQKWNTENEYLNWCYEWIDLSIEKLSPNGSLYLMSATQFMPFFDLHVRKKLKILSRIVWHYDSSGVQAKNFYGSLYEPILFCVKNKNNYTFNSNSILVKAKTGSDRKLIDYRKAPPQLYNTKKIPGNVWYFPRVRYKMKEYENHPTQKPISLLERIILASSNQGDTVLDLFSGTFTTSFVSKMLNRKSIGIEIEKEYIEIGIKRLELERKQYVTLV